MYMAYGLYALGPKVGIIIHILGSLDHASLIARNMARVSEAWFTALCLESSPSPQRTNYVGYCWSPDGLVRAYYLGTWEAWALYLGGLGSILGRLGLCTWEAWALYLRGLGSIQGS